MTVERRLDGKQSVTLRALIRLLSSMRPKMSDQITRFLKALPAIIASVKCLHSMQVCYICKKYELHKLQPTAVFSAFKYLTLS